MTAIYHTYDFHEMLHVCGASDLKEWHEDYLDLDWETMLNGGMHLITDGDRSYCLIERHSEDEIEGHVIICDKKRGLPSIEIAWAMLRWIDENVAHTTMLAKTTKRSTELWLRWLGFQYFEDRGGYHVYRRER